MHIMGIDGGGSSVRVVITTAQLDIIAQETSGSANPNSAGREAAARHIQEAMRAALTASGLQPHNIRGAAAGVAGAMTAPIQTWLDETLRAVLPDTPLVLTTDFELALVGANGERRGVLVLSGTGSVIYGVNAAAEAALVGGWGYLLGDEGSGYWIGLKGLTAAARYADGRGEQTRLLELVMTELALHEPRQLVDWLYRQPRTRDIAALAPLVLAAEDDPVAAGIIAEGAAELALAARTVMTRLNMVNPPVAFAGGLLSELNPLSRRLCARLELPDFPVAKYPPVMGAVLLALEKVKSDS